MSDAKKNITNTFFSTALVLLLQVANIILSTHLLGSEGRGQISMYLLHIAIGAQVGSIIGGEALVFFASRYRLKSLIYISVKWNLFIALLSMLAFWFLDFSLPILLILGGAIFLQSSFQLLVQIGMGNMHITKANSSFLISQLVFTCGILLLHASQNLTEISFIVAYMLGLFVAIIYMIYTTKQLNPNTELPNLSFTKAFSNGFIIQFGNVAQTFNLRLSYFLLNSLFINGTALVGVYSVALLVSEKALVIPRSLGRVQYAETANKVDAVAIRTTQYFKLYITLAVLVMLILFCLPSSLYTIIFGREFADVGFYIRLLIPAMILLMGSNAMSNYFAGRGLYKVNSVCTLIALTFSSIAAFLLIPTYAILGAAISTSIAFATLCGSQVWYFNKKNPELPKLWILPNQTDWNILKSALTKVK